MRTRLIAGIILVVFLYGMTCVAAFAQLPWPMFRYDQQRSGAAMPDTLGTWRPKPIWIFPYPEKSVDPVDNDYPGRDGLYFETTGTWDSTPLNALNPYGDDYLLTQTDATGSKSATWIFNMTDIQSASGADYLIWVWFPSYQLPGSVVDNRPHCRDAHYSVTINGVVIGEYTLDQTTGGGWVNLGRRTFRLRKDDILNVVLSNKTEIPIDPDNPTYVIADAVMIEQDAGAVYSSPVVSTINDVAVSCVTRNIPLEGVSGLAGSVDLGIIYGIGTEQDSSIPGPTDDRGFQKWQYPLADRDWITGGVSSSPVLAFYGGSEVAVVPAGDGMVYAVDTATGELKWKGPGYVMGDPSSRTGTWNAGAGSGFRGTGYWYTNSASVGSPSATATWDQTVGKKGRYAIYAWIPPAISGTNYLPDARYTVTVGSDSPVTAIVNQGVGGAWVRIGSSYQVDAASTGITVELTNESLFTSASPYAVADGLKIVPADLGSFEFSSPVTDGAEGIYIATAGGRVMMLTMGNADPDWVYPDPNDSVSPHPIGAVYASPALDGDTLYVGSSDGHVYALSADGALRWVYPSKTPDSNGQIFTLPQISSTTAVGGYVYVGTGAWGSSGYTFNTEGRILALRKADGSVAWWYPDDDPDAGSKGSFLYSSPLLINLPSGTPGLFIGSTDGRMYGVDPNTGAGFVESGTWGAYPNLGASMYSSAAGNRVTATYDLDNNPLGSTALAFVGTNGDRISRVNLNLNNGKVDWWWDLHGDVRSSPGLCEERVYVGDTGGFTWAFSTRTDPGTGNTQEGWNVELGAEPDTGGSDKPGGPAEPEIDVFRAAEYDAIVAAAKASLPAVDGTATPIDQVAGGVNPDLHTLARRNYESSELYKHEWGEDIYVIVWNLVNPNKDGQLPPPQSADFKSKVNHKVEISIRPEGAAGRDADVLETHQIQNNSSYFVTAVDPGTRMPTELVYYAIYKHVLDGSAPGRAQTPGDKLIISVKEVPEASLDRASSEDAYVTRLAPTDPPDPNAEPQLFAINNPIALSYGTDQIGVTVAGTSVTTSRDNSLAGVNGNPGVVPDIWVGYASHNTTSAAPEFSALTPQGLGIFDRSLLGWFGRSITRFRLERQDLKWLGGAGQVVNPIVQWEILPPDSRTNTPNISEDYPDIPGRQIAAKMSGDDATMEPVELRPGPGAGAPSPPGPAESWTVGSNPLSLSATVPRFQPANIPINPSDPVSVAASGYWGGVIAYVDSDGNGIFNRPAALGADVAQQQKMSKGSRVEAYRELSLGLHVPIDRRVRIDETILDIGEVPHGFGLIPGPGGVPVQFHDALGVNLQAPPAGFNRWFKPFTAYNIGNTNLLNVRVAVAGNMNRPWGELVSDTVQDPSTGSGYLIPGASTANNPGVLDAGAYVVSSLDPIFWDDPAPWGSLLAPGMVTRTFHKARVGDTEPMLTVPDLPRRLYRTVPGFEAHKPALSIAVPVGQPAGRYYGAFTLFEDMPLPLGLRPGEYEPGRETLGDPIVNLQVRVSEARMTDDFTVGSEPHLDSGSSTPAGPTGDSAPAAYRDGVTGNLHMVWSSSRAGMDVLGNTEPVAADPWYLYMTTLQTAAGSGAPGGWRFMEDSPARWWLATTSNMAGGGPGDPFPSPNDVDNYFPWSVLAQSVKFTSPSIATDEFSGGSWLFFGGEAQAATATAPGSKGRPTASKVYYTEITGGDLGNSGVFFTTRDWTMPKFGIRGAVSRERGAAMPVLWSFWYGGNNGKWRIYYNANPDPDDPNAWTNEAQLPMPKGLSAAAEPSPVFRWWNGGTGLLFDDRSPEMTGTVLDVVYSGYSTFHKNSDIYMSRYRARGAQSSTRQGGHWVIDPVPLPMRGMREVIIGGSPTEVVELTRDPAKAIWYSKDVAWASRDPIQDFRVYVFPDRNDLLGSPPYLLNMGEYTKDSTTGAIAFTYEADPVLQKLYRAVVINPEQGTVKFLRSPGANALVAAQYKPMAYRLTGDSLAAGTVGDSASDVSPCAFWDDDRNPRYDSARANNPFFVPGADVSPPTDRLWVFWRRPGVDKPGTGIHYKTYRYAVRLGHQIALEDLGGAAGGPLVTSITDVTQIYAKALTFPVEVDWMKRTLYFSREDAIWEAATANGLESGPRTYEVTYVDANGISQTERLIVEFAEDGMGRESPGATTFGSLASVMVNEGQVNAFKDPWDNKVWAFWTSTRSGNTDIFYEAVSPKFYGVRY